MTRPNAAAAYVALVAAACGALLVAGALVRPVSEPDELTAAATPDLPQLGRYADRRMLERMAEYFSHAASLAEESVVLLAVSGQTGVVWQSGEIVTSARLGPFPATDRTVLDGDVVDLATSIAGPPKPYVLLQAPRGAIVISRSPARLYAHGAWLLALWRTADGELLHEPGNLFGFLERDCGSYRLTEVLTNFDLAGGQAGGGVFSLDGGLIAVVLDCAGEMIAAEASALELQVRSTAAGQDTFAMRYGMSLGLAGPEVLAALGGPPVGNVLVRETWWGHSAHRAGLEPGDLIFSIEGASVESVDELDTLLLPVSREHFDLGVWRAGRRSTVRLPARAATADIHAGLGFIRDREGLELSSVLGGSPASQAGARPGDRVLSVNQEPVRSIDELERAISEAPGGLLHLVLARSGRYWGALVRVDE